MRKYIITVILLSIGLTSFGQNLNGTIVYHRKVDFISIMTRLPFLSSEEIDRIKLTWGSSSDRKGQEHLFYFNEAESLYTIGEEDNEGGYSWGAQEKYFLLRDFKKKTVKDWREILGKKYVVEDNLPKFKWKILNEIKEIEGYLCMKAETYDSVKDQVIHAWFADGIIFSGGPEGYSGLPGLILELNINDGDVVVTASKVTLTSDKVDIPMPKKIKGKSIDIKGFDEIVKNFINQQIEAERNPYWRIRY